MSLKRRVFTREFKLQVIAEVKSGKPMAQVARTNQLNPNTIAKWRKQLHQYQDRAFAGNGHPYTDDARVAELERLIGQLTVENDTLKKPCGCSNVRRER